MSPLLRSKHKIFLFQDRLEVETVHGKSLERQIVPCLHQDRSSSWSGPFDTLLHALNSLKLGRAPVTLVISNTFFRYTSIPWSSTLIKPEDELRLARICFEKIYGDMDGWRIRIDKSAYGHTRIATAIPENHIESITSAFKNFRLASIQPLLMHAFNQCRGNFTGRSFIFAMPESTKVCLASLRQGQWLGVRNVNCSGASDHAMLARRELLARGLEQDSGIYWLHDSYDEQKRSKSRIPPLDLNFHERSTNRKTFLAIALGVELLVGGYAIYQYQNLENGIYALQASTDQKNAIAHESALNTPEEKPEKIMAELGVAGNAIASLSTPWGKLFDLVEHSLGKDVALLSIEPDTQAKNISITAESKDYASMMQYAKRLRNDPLVSNVNIINHQTQTSDPQKPIRFSLFITLNQSSF